MKIFAVSLENGVSFIEFAESRDALQTKYRWRIVRIEEIVIT